MSDDRTSALQCPQCGQRLVEDAAGDILNCPVHGPIGRFHDLAMTEVSDILREVREAFDEALVAVDVGTPSASETHSFIPGAGKTEWFEDLEVGPEMVVVPAGSFIMGSPESEDGRDKDESPQHKVTFAKPFAVSRFLVTFNAWDACAADGGCNGYTPEDEGWGRDHRPVINVSWDDANAYIDWLATRTGKPYRLLSEAEWEYAMRAGTTTAYPWGSFIGSNTANCHGCASRWDGEKTAPVGSFAANGFGLFDMAGNVYEWTQDCYHDSYNGAPADGSAWSSDACTLRVVRGGSWLCPPRHLRSADRSGWIPGDRDYDVGFRVARTLLTP
jgi:formylglycine-generating enzyme required for sulfatase activity